MHQPMLWTTEYGKGRVFTTALGHDVEQVQTPAFITTFTRRGVGGDREGHVAHTACYGEIGSRFF